MKRFFIILSICLVVITLTAMAQDPGEQICGTWLNEEKDSHIEIFRRNGKFYGKVVWLKEPLDKEGKPVTDLNNPDPKLQKRPILGIEIISGLEYRNNKWVNGTIYAPKRGQYAECSAIISSKGTLELTVRKSFFSATKSFTRL